MNCAISTRELRRPGQEAGRHGRRPTSSASYLRAASCLLAVAVLLQFAVSGAVAETSAQVRERGFRERTRPLLQKFCADCHSGDSAEGGLSLDRYRSAHDVLVGRGAWLTVLGKLRVKAMPPADAPQPSDQERSLLIAWIDDAINNIDCDRDARPGHVTIRRLNRAEYRNTMRDLLGIDYEPAADFPADDIGYGFDNIGDVLSLPPLLMEKYLEAAEAISASVIATEGLEPPRIFHQRGAALAGAGGEHGDGARMITSDGTAHAECDVPENGAYEIEITAFGDQAGGEPVKMGLRWEGKEVREFVVKAEESSPEVYRASVRAKPGKQRVEVSFLNDYYRPDASDPRERDRNLIISQLSVRGPIDKTPELPAAHRRIFFVQPSDKLAEDVAARKILERLASRAYRRPATSEEVDRLLQLLKLARDGGDRFEQAMQVALQAILVSPHFLFRIEADPTAGQSERPLNDYELATRLSYFLWSSMPDDALFAQAFRGTLRRGDNLQQQVQRLLSDPKSRALGDNFAAQWLQLRKFEEVTPSERHFPAFDASLRADMVRETRLLFDDVVRQDRSVIELLAADYSFLNERLARHYGIPGVAGDEFRRVSLQGTPRGGLITHGSILTVTSNPTRTSPVKRGRWILENLLGEPPPPPPPDVPELVPMGQDLTGTLRQRMEQHRSNPNCAVCHEQMDALGFALENFDAVGAWRLFDGKQAIDASGELPGGKRFRGSAELLQILRTERQDQFVRCLTEKMLTYALGRGLEYYDQCAVDRITKRLSAEGFRFSALVLAIVESEPFQMQGAREGAP